eukprot:g10591.t1
MCLADLLASRQNFAPPLELELRRCSLNAEGVLSLWQQVVLDHERVRRLNIAENALDVATLEAMLEMAAHISAPNLEELQVLPNPCGAGPVAKLFQHLAPWKSMCLQSPEAGANGFGHTSTDRLRFLQKLDRHGPYRENERLERLEALMELRAHALRYQNCWHLWKDEEVRDCLLDALEAPDPERGKSLYVEEGPPPNHPSVRTAAFGILVQLALDEAVREEMAQHELLRASVVEALRPEMKEDTVTAPDDEDEDEDFIWMEESEEEEEMEDDPVLDPTKDPTGEMSSDLGQMDSVDKAEAQPEAPAEAEGGAESEADPDALLAEVEDILTAKKPSSDEDLLDALVTAACPDAEQLLQLDSLPPWRPGAALARRLDSLWTLAATRDNAESGQLCRFERVKEALLFGADVTQPDCVRISALGALTALMARNENKQSMWQDPEVQKVLVSGAADQIFAPSSEVSQHQLRPQATELRLQALLGLSMLAECDELRPEIWQDQRLVASLQDAVEKPGPLRPIALQVLQHLSQSWENREDMIKAEIPKLIGAALPEDSEAEGGRPAGQPADEWGVQGTR